MRKTFLDICEGARPEALCIKKTTVYRESSTFAQIMFELPRYEKSRISLVLLLTNVKLMNASLQSVSNLSCNAFSNSMTWKLRKL